jgi:glycosyltransferase involved in cell wall biosynthesis
MDSWRKEKMRIAIVAGPYVPVPPKGYGGAEQVIHYLIKGLLEAGHEPILLASGDSEVDCQLIPVVPKALSFAKTPADFESYAQEVRAAEERTATKLREILPTIDIIHSHGFDLKQFANFPNLTTLHNEVVFHDDNNPKNLAYYLERTELNYVSISQNQQASCPELNYVDVVYNGEDPGEFPLVKRPEDYVCFLGRFDRKKNPHMAIELALEYGIKIKIAGKIDHESEGYFEHHIAPYLDNPLVEYLGELGFKDKVELLSNARCNLHPTSFREPFGLTVLEAAYCGTPTLAIARGSMPELIEFGRTGIWVEDFVEGYHHLDECFKMDRTYIAFRSRQLFNYHAMAKQYIAAYKSVIHGVEIPYKARLENTHLSQGWIKSLEIPRFPHRTITSRIPISIPSRRKQSPK